MFQILVSGYFYHKIFNKIHHNPKIFFNNKYHNDMLIIILLIFDIMISYF